MSVTQRQALAALSRATMTEQDYAILRQFVDENTRAPAGGSEPTTLRAVVAEQGWRIEGAWVIVGGDGRESGEAIALDDAYTLIRAGASASADERSAAVPPKLTDAQIKKAVGASDEFWATSKLFIIGIARAIEDAVCASGSGERETADGWRSIETAPKDGTLVMLWGVSAGEISGPSKTAGIEIGSYSGTGGDFAGFEWSSALGDAYAVWVQPTHWMPLPSPPSSEVAAGVPEGAQGQQQGRQGEA